MGQVVQAIYEAFRTYDGKVALAPEHQARWEKSLKSLNFRGEIPDLLELAASELNKVREGDLKVKVAMDLQGNVELSSWEVPKYEKSFFWSEPWKVKRVEGMRVHPEIKNTMTEFVTEQRAIAAKEKYEEILMIDESGQVREGGWTNVFFEKNGVLITPEKGVLPGIARQLVLLAAERLEIPTEVRDVHVDELDEMDSSFHTSSVRGIVPTGEITPMMQRLAGWCRSLIDQRINRPVETKIMGVVNVTPDSFSDGGRFENTEQVVDVVTQMIKDGASVIDIGGESTGPGSSDISLDEELSRVIPAIEAIRAAHPTVKISIDTWKSEVAEAAVKAGATMINDITGGRGDERIAEVAAKAEVPLVLMYSKDENARTTAEAVEYDNVMVTIKSFLKERIEWAESKGVKEVIIDPGMGAFLSTNPKYSFEVMDRIEEIRDLGRPILVGVSRKSCLGDDRFGGTVATSLWLKGRVDYLRVHDVFENATVVNL